MDVKSLLPLQSLQDYNQELEEAEAHIAQGDFVTHEQVLKRLES